MSELSSEIFFHKAELARVCQGLRAGKHYLVVGPLGIGKSAFLRNVESYWKSTVAAQEKAFQFWHVDFSRQPALTVDQARRFREEVLTDLRAYARDEEHVTICLMDHTEKAITRAEVYDLSFFEALAICKDSLNLRYVIASERSLLEQLRQAYPDPEQRKRYKLPVIDTTIFLGLVPIKEADTFIAEAGGHRRWKVEMPWLVEHTRTIHEIVGCYPLFLKLAIEELYSIFGQKRAFDAEEFRSRFLRSVNDRYQGIWESLDEKEKPLLFRLSGDGAPSEEERAVLENLRSKALITDDCRVFSTTFQHFVSEYTEYAPVPWYQKLWSILWPFGWTRERTAYAMLGLLLLYAIVVPVIGIKLEDSFWMVVSLVIFVLAFAFLLVLYLAR